MNEYKVDISVRQKDNRRRKYDLLFKLKIAIISIYLINETLQTMISGTQVCNLTFNAVCFLGIQRNCVPCLGHCFCLRILTKVTSLIVPS